MRSDHSDPDTSDPDTLFGLSFESVSRAQQFMLAIDELARHHRLRLVDAVMVVKDEDDRVRVRETIDPQPGRSALSGAVWTGLLGLIVGGPVGWIAGLGIGAASGVVTAKIVDLGIPDEWVAWFRDAVDPGTSTVVILADHIYVRALAQEARRFAGADLLYTSMPDYAFEQLRAALES